LRSDAELQQLLLAPYVCFGGFQFGALAFCFCGFRCFT
jgi:hypothetical protein